MLQGRLKLTARKESMMSTSSTETSPEVPTQSQQSQSALHFTKSIEEIDRRLKSMDDRKPTLDMTIKDPSVYENKADSWLRQHLNTIKQQNHRRSETEEQQMAVGSMDVYQMRRGYTADVIERRPKAKKEAFTTPKMERKSKSYHTLTGSNLKKYD